jgi:hypothetical protein
MINHCYKCKDRKVGCHLVCERYAEYRKEIEKTKQKKIEILKQNHDHIEILMKSKKKRRK